MCGIYGTNCLYCNDYKIIENIKKNQRYLRHRGPDCYNTVKCNNVYLAHHRLAIIDTSLDAKQPFVSNNKLIYLTINGEIYNYNELYDNIYERKSNYKRKSKSDCEVIMALYEEIIYSKELYDIDEELIKLLNNLDGMFSFILYDVINNKLLVARDPYGITSLYYGMDKEGYLHVSSELKAFQDNNIKPRMFPAGNYVYYDTLSNKKIEFKTYYKFMEILKNTVDEKLYLQNRKELWDNEEYIKKCSQKVNNTLTKAVYKRLQSNVPFTMLLSGGLDSSLVCSIACKILRGELEGYSLKKMSNIRFNDEINTFSIGFDNSPDLEASEKVAKYLKTNHHSLIITIEEALTALRDVVWHLETYDVTTIRASIPMYLLSRRIKSLGYKMVLSGEGSDEILGGYLYFLNAPNSDEHTKECIRRVYNLQYFDNLRANKSSLAWGLEPRVPFLDRNFVELGLKIPSELKRKNGIEKWILRQAFNPSDYQQKQYLPDELLWRQKEQFSDGVGYIWIDTLKDIAENSISQLMMINSHVYYPINTPKTKEEYYYRTIFEDIYKDKGFEYCVKKWVPNMDWDNVSYDPSGRSQKNHEDNSNWS